MSNFASIYVRTPQGRITAFDPTSSLASRLKKVLRAVDGHSSVAALSSQFAPWSDVVNLLEQLHQTGLIEDKTAAVSTASWASPQHFDTRQPSGWPATVPLGLDFKSRDSRSRL